jgi:TonB family protein
MSSAATIHKQEPPSRDRRCWPREPVQQAVLVFFGESNWGKLIDLGESGMSFEFTEAPPLRQRINFKFETMGCTAAHLGRQHFNDSFGLAGEVVWTRQFERAAGVRFLDLPESSRQQILSLVSFETTANAATADEATKSDVLVREIEPAEPTEPAESTASPPEALSEGEGENTLAEAEAADSWTPPEEDLDSEQIRKILEAPTFESYKNLPIEEPPGNLDPLGSKSRVVRIGLIAVFVSLAILAAVVAATKIPTRWVRRAQATEQVPRLPAGPESRSAGLTPQPFAVEVSDLNNKRWLLWFDRNLPKSLPMPVVLKSVMPSSSFEPKKKATGHEQPSAAEKRSGLQGKRHIQPQLSRPTNPLAARPSGDAASVSLDVPAAPTLGSAAGIPTPAEIPAPIARSLVAGGKVQQARLLKSVSPTYPELARSLRLAGNVTLDALISEDGSVRDVKVVSGPVLLQQAAINAVRQWKYEPARLDGRPAAMHLSITVKFSSQQ